MWLARLVGLLMPEPDLWLLLDAPVEVVRARKQEVSEKETARQLDAYRSFIEQENIMPLLMHRSLWTRSLATQMPPLSIHLFGASRPNQSSIVVAAAALHATNIYERSCG